MKVRAARGDDREILLALRSALWPDREVARHEKEIRQRADSPARYETLVAEGAEGQVVGFAELAREQDVGSTTARVALDALFVAPPHRRQGAARALLEAAEQWAHSRGALSLSCDLPASEHTALQALAWLGFGDPLQRVQVSRRVSARASLARPTAAAAPTAPVGARRPEPVLVVQPAGSSWFPAFNVMMILAAVASFLFTDIFAKDVVRGVVLPLLDVGFVLYFVGLFIVMRYRKRTDSGARAERLFRHDS